MLPRQPLRFLLAYENRGAASRALAQVTDGRAVAPHPDEPSIRYSRGGLALHLKDDPAALDEAITYPNTTALRRAARSSGEIAE
jgi:hypothetical protein